MDRFLYISTYLFLALPYLAFFGGWLRQPYSLIAVLVLLMGTIVAIRNAHLACLSTTRGHFWTAGSVLTAIVPALVLAPLVGVGGWGYQDADWLTHNGVFRDLVNQPWPVIYETSTGPLLQVYYTAFYLPAALVGKLLGWHAANHALFLYFAFGLCISMLWVRKLSGVGLWWCVPVFLAFSGMDIIGQALRFVGEAATGAQSRQSWENLEWWAGYGVASYGASFDQLVMGPKQTLAGWLLTALVLSDAREQRLPQTGVFYLGLSTLWNPYVSIGILPFVLVLALPGLLRKQKLAAFMTWPNAAGLLAGLIVFVYVISRYWPYTLPIDVSGLYQEGLTLNLLYYGKSFLLVYPVFIALEFGILHALFYACLRGNKDLLDPPLRRLLYVSTVALCVLPWIKLSWNNDIVVRASIPMLFITALVAVCVLASRDTGTRRWLRTGVLAILCIGWINFAWILVRQVEGAARQGALVVIPDPARILTPFELQRQRYNKIGFNQVGQYMGSLESPFAKYLMARRDPGGPGSPDRN
jgi:hypothetical protein